MTMSDSGNEVQQKMTLDCIDILVPFSSQFNFPPYLNTLKIKWWNGPKLQKLLPQNKYMSTFLTLVLRPN